MQTLNNGMRLVVCPRRWNQILAMHLFFDGGASEDPEGKAGLANLAQRLLIKGAGKRTAQEIAETIESVGGSIDVSADLDFLEASVETTVGDMQLAMDLLAEVVLRPTFPPDELEKERALVLSAIRRQEDDQFSFTYREFLKALYEGHPYGRPVLGESGAVSTLTRDDVAASHARRLRSGRMLLCVCGDVDPGEVARLAEKTFQTVPQLAPETRMLVRKRTKPVFRDLQIHKDCKQAFIVSGYPAVPLAHLDYPALRVANAMLGEGMSSRLFRRLRDDRSLAYSVGSSLSGRLSSGHLAMWIGTSPERAEPALLGLRAQVRELAAGADSDELGRAKQYVIGKHLIARQSNSQKARSLGASALLGVGVDYDDRFPALIEEVTPNQALQALSRYSESSVSVTLMPGTLA